MVSVRAWLRLAFGVLTAAACVSASAATLNGRIVDSQEQRVFADALVTVAGYPAVRSDAQGFFRVVGVGVGPLQLQVELPDGRSFAARAVMPARPSLFVELDQSRHAPPSHDDEY
jgi:hypothetical protein